MQLQALAVQLFVLGALICVATAQSPIEPPQCPCSVFPTCAQSASSALTQCVTTCRTQPPLSQEDCMVACNLHFQVVLQQTRTCPSKACSSCDDCAPLCTAGVAACKVSCSSNAACLTNCTKSYASCNAQLIPCAIPAPAATPAPVTPIHTRDMALINQLNSEALTLTNGVFYSTAPHKLPYQGVTTIGRGEFLQSPSGVFVLQFLDNGDLGLFAGNVQLWMAARTANRGTPGHVAFDPQTGVMQMFSSSDELWWDSCIHLVLFPSNPYNMDDPGVIPRWLRMKEPNVRGGKAPYELIMTDNGNVEIVDVDGKVWFETATSNQGQLLTDITSKAEYATGVSTPQSLMTFLSEWSAVPVDLRIMFETAAYADEDQWQLFSMHFSQSMGDVDEWIGAAKQVNGTISLLYIHLHSTGNPVQQYTPVQVPSCHRCWFHTCCSTNTIEVPRGFEPEELVSMVISLRRAGFFALENIISTL